jgi:hypothetical protein
MTCCPDASPRPAGQRLLKRPAEHPGPRFADYVAVDEKFATAPFLHATEEVGPPVIARRKDNLPELPAAVAARFSQQPLTTTFEHGEDGVEVWDADDF